MGHRDADGYYYITDRKKDMLIVNGINVYPREIEEVIYHYPGVREAAVIGVPDARRGEQAVAFVSAVEGQSLEEKALICSLSARNWRITRCPNRFSSSLPCPKTPPAKF